MRKIVITIETTKLGSWIYKVEDSAEELDIAVSSFESLRETVLNIVHRVFKLK